MSIYISRGEFLNFRDHIESALENLRLKVEQMRIDVDVLEGGRKITHDNIMELNEKLDVVDLEITELQGIEEELWDAENSTLTPDQQFWMDQSQFKKLAGD